MFDPTYKQLKERGFEPARLSKNNRSFPEYMKFQDNEILILAEYAGEREYIIHRLYNRFGRHYSPIEVQTLKKFENINSLDELISFLIKDEELCELNPPY